MFNIIEELDMGLRLPGEVLDRVLTDIPVKELGETLILSCVYANFQQGKKAGKVESAITLLADNKHLNGVSLDGFTVYTIGPRFVLGNPIRWDPESLLSKNNGNEQRE